MCRAARQAALANARRNHALPQGTATSLNHSLQVAGYATHSVLIGGRSVSRSCQGPRRSTWCVSSPAACWREAGRYSNRAKVPPASRERSPCGGCGGTTFACEHHPGGAAGRRGQDHPAVDVMPQKLAWAEDFGATTSSTRHEDSPSRACGDQRQRWGGLAVRDESARRRPSRRTCSPPSGGRRRRRRMPGRDQGLARPALFMQRACDGELVRRRAPGTDVADLLIDCSCAGKYKLKEMISRKVPLTPT